MPCAWGRIPEMAPPTALDAARTARSETAKADAAPAAARRRRRVIGIGLDLGWDAGCPGSPADPPQSAVPGTGEQGRMDRLTGRVVSAGPFPVGGRR